MYIPRQGPSPEALLRFLAVSKVIGLERQGKRRAEAVRQVCSEPLVDLKGRRRVLTERTLYRWLQHAAMVDNGKARGSEPEVTLLEALEPAQRRPFLGSKVLSQDLLDYCRHQKKLDERASVPELIRRARVDGILGQTEAVCRSTLYRTLKRLGVCVQLRRKSGPHRDSRRYAFPHRMQCVLCDGKHFRAGLTRAKRVALIFLDDSSRYALDAFVAPSENKLIFLLGLFKVIIEYGLMELVYLDKGPGFVAGETIKVIARFGHLVHGETAYPQGHGKIERFNRTLKADLLRSFDGDPTVETDCSHLRLRLLHYLRTDYNVRAHEGLDGRTPRECFLADERELVFPENMDVLQQKFIIDLKRRVSWDNIVKVDAKALEVPRGYAGAYVALQRRMFDDTVHFLHKGELIELHEVDKEANARAKRSKKSAKESPSFVKTAAHRKFDKDYQPITNADGGFPNTDEE